jgi:ABC-type polysaccharide/polyol phosphate transport system ATPase subunit
VAGWLEKISDMNDIAIYVEGLSKSYRVGRKQASYSTFRESIQSMMTASLRRLKSSLGGHSAVDTEEEIWALKDVSFEIKQGEIVGIIGRNGAGKSTLLKLLSSITEPTCGHARIHGRIGSLLEVGTGFHQELTGRENIFLNGAILGMKRTEINSKFDEIVAFAEVDKFIDTPVKHYSSGMYLKLAFAVAAHLETDILLVDEVLAVGDINFQQKCIQKMSEVSELGQTILVVSHNLRVVETLTNRCIYLKEGVVSNIGETKHIVREYQKDALSTLKFLELPSEFDMEVNNSVIKISDFVITDRANNRTNSFKPETSIKLTCLIESRQTLENIVVCLRFCKDKIVVSGNNSEHKLGKLSISSNEKYKLSIFIDGLWLIPGNYSVVLFVLPDYFSGVSASLSDFQVEDFIIVGSRSYGGGYVSIKQKWNFEREQDSLI